MSSPDSRQSPSPKPQLAPSSHRDFNFEIWANAVRPQLLAALNKQQTRSLKKAAPETEETLIG